MNDFIIRTVVQSCPVCGAEPQYRVWSRFISGNTTHIISERHKIVGSTTTPLVCIQCGYVQLFVDPSDFSMEPPQ